MPVFDSRGQLMYKVGLVALKPVYVRSQTVADCLHIATHTDSLVWIYETCCYLFLSKVALSALLLWGLWAG